MKFTVYSKNGCPYCDKVKQVLQLSKLEHVIYKLDEDLWSILKTFVIYLERLPEFPITALHDISIDEKCLELLNDI